jgi:hypothetical protein
MKSSGAGSAGGHQYFAWGDNRDVVVNFTHPHGRHDPDVFFARRLTPRCCPEVNAGGVALAVSAQLQGRHRSDPLNVWLVGPDRRRPLIEF